MGVLTAVLNTLTVILSLFMICLVLIQRGKGGGLAGAFGGAGGSSAFGTKAGDTFTRITIAVASIWILMTMLLVVLTSRQNTSIFDADEPTSISKDLGSSSSSTAVPPIPVPVPADGQTPAVESAPESTDKAPAIPETSNFPLTPGNAEPPSPN